MVRWVLQLRLAARRWVSALPRLYAAVAMVVGCSSDFPNEPVSAVTLETDNWPAELHVTDVDTIEINVKLRDGTQSITGLRVRWASSDDGVLRVVQLQPPAGGSLEDTLVAQRRAEVTAMSGGPDTVRVLVEAGGAFEPAESTYVIRVTQRWVAVSAGKAHTCGITVDSVPYCWGEGLEGKLGNGRRIDSPIPVRVLGVDNLKFVAVSAGDQSTCGLIAEGIAYCWGSNDEGRLGNGDSFERSEFLPTPVTGFAFRSLQVGRVGCGVTDELTAYCWGGNADRQLGHFAGEPPVLDTCLNSNPAGCRRTPLRVSSDDATPAFYTKLTIGGHHVCGISAPPRDGQAFCWGTGPTGALGNATITATSTAVPVAGGLTLAAISAGGDHTCGLTPSMSTYCWGANTDGQIGDGGSANSMVPVAVLSGTFAVIEAGGRHTCVLTASGQAFCWGLGSSGQLGNGSTVQRPSPFGVSGALVFESLTAGESHTCGIVSGGSLYCWGEGTNGRLGTADVQNRLAPTRVAEPE